MSGNIVQVEKDNGNVTYSVPVSNEIDLNQHVWVMIQGINLKDNNIQSDLLTKSKSFANYPNISLQVQQPTGEIVDQYKIPGGLAPSLQEKIFNQSISIQTGSKLGLSIDGNNIKSQKYSIIKSNTKPTLQNVSWIDLTDQATVEKIETNTIQAYPDLKLDKEGYLATKHYIYAFDNGKYPAGQTPPRAETFGNPIGNEVVEQKASSNIPNGQTNYTYSSNTDQLVFFGNSEIGSGANRAVKFWGYIQPNQTGYYQLGAYSDDGAYGYLIIDNQKTEFVNNWQVQAAFDRTNGNSMKLEKDRKSTRLNYSHITRSRMPSSA